MTERLVYSVAELQEALGISRRSAYRVAGEIGVRVSPRRIVIPVRRLQDWLTAQSENGKAAT